MNLQSKFSQFTDTNYAPSAHERSEIRTLVREPAERLKAIDEEISRLLSERTEINTFVEDHHALLNPFRRLPTDVWREIFIECLPVNKLGVALRTTEQAPLLLTRICKSWHEVALTTPRLWNAIHIFLPPAKGMANPYSLMQGRKEGLKAWLDRSGSLPLTISLSTGVAPNTSTPGIDQGYADIIELLVRYSPRWKTIALGPRIASLNLQPLERLKAEDLPLLQAVHSSTNLFAFPSNPISPPSPTPLANLLTHAPSLRSLHLACELVPSVDLPLRWSRLTELRINSLTSYASVTIEPSQLVQKLAETCHSLIKLSIRASLPFPPHVFSTPAEPLDWESLREFEIMFEGYCYEFSNGGTQTRFSTGIRNTFKAFTAPNLRHLSFHIISLSNTGSAEVPPGLNEEGAPFEEFISRSRCMLTVLDVSLPRSLNVEAVSKSLRLLPSLKSLKLGHPVRRNSPAPDLQTLQVLREWIKAVFHALLLPDMCEDLEELECEGCYADADAAGLMVDLAFARQRLKAFKADFGTVSRGGVDILVSCLNAKVRELRETRKVQVDWTWQEEAPPKEAVKETPESGLPGTNEWW